jgi:hypothetical protein
MSLVSDILSTFQNENRNAQDYSIYLFNGNPIPNATTAKFNIYAVMEDSFSKQNTISDRPLEQSQFTVDSVQIKPYRISIKGFIYPDDDTFITSYDELRAYISTQLDLLNNYTDGIQLFMLFNSFTFSNIGYYPLKLFDVNAFKDTNNTIPEVTLQFQQVQSGTAQYGSANANNQNEPQNNPNQPS